MLFFDKILYSLILGILVSHALFAYGIWWMCMGLLIMCFVLLGKRRWIVAVLCVLLVAGRYTWYERVELHHLIDNLPQENLTIQGSICAEPDKRLLHINYVLCVEDVEFVLKNNIVRKPPRFLLKTRLYPEFEYGDVVEVSAKIEEPFETDDFSYKDYLKISKVSGVLKTRQIPRLLYKNETFLTYVYRIKMLIIQKFEYQFFEPVSSLINGLFLGVKKGFTDEHMNQLKFTGLTHVIAVSGFHVGLVILFVDRFFFFVPRNLKVYLLLIILILFMFLAGLSASVIRACFMGGLNILILRFGYTSNITRSLLLVAFGMVYANPSILFFDLGFQLSFFATLGIAFLPKYLDFKFLPDMFGIRESIIFTLSATVTTLPIVTYHFGLISFIAPVANLLITPLLPIIMLLGFCSFVMGFIPVLSSVLILLVNIFATLFFVIIKMLSSVDWFYLQIDTKDLKLVISMYVICLVAVLYLDWKSELKQKL